MATLARADVTARQGTTSLGLVIGSILAGGAGALFGVGGFLAVVLGDQAVSLDLASTLVAVLASLGFVGAILVRDRPGTAAVGMSLAPIAQVLVLGGSFGTWWARYEDAINTSGAAENAFWSAMPALGLFSMSGVLLALGAVLAALSWCSNTTEEGGIS